jgi:hypothetical protein
MLAVMLFLRRELLNFSTNILVIVINRLARKMADFLSKEVN